MSKKLGVFGIVISVATVTSLGGSLLLVQKANEQEQIMNQNIQVLNNKIQSNGENNNSNEQISELSKSVENISSDLIILTENVNGLKQTVEGLPEFVELTDDGKIKEDVEDKEDKEPATTENTDTTPKPTETVTKPKPTDVVTETPTIENPTFKTTTRLNFRTEPGLNAKISTTFNPNEVLTWFNGETVQKDGHTWIKVVDSKGNKGWVSQKFTTKQ